MGFKFGVLTELDFKITLYCFVLVVAFVIAAEYVLGVLEYFLEGSRLYSQMIEKIYKELMLMGMLTFCVMMYEAVPRNEEDVEEREWMESIDFSHVYLFFVTFFFVMHAFYLMVKSVSAVSEYRLMYSEKTDLMIENLQNLKSSWWGSFLFNLKMLPFCSTRYHVEFSLTQSLFTKLYRLPEDVDFPYYLSGCFDRFALRTINRSMFTWIVLLFFVVVNYVSIKYNLTVMVFDAVYGYLEIPLTEAQMTATDLTPKDVMIIFAVAGIFLVLYTIILTLITRVYKARLVDRVYPNHSSIDDYIQLLRAKQREHAHPNEQAQALRMSAATLKKEIEIEFDQKEEGEVEDEEGIKYVAETVRSTYKWVTESISDTLLCLRVKAHDCCGGDDRRRGSARTNLLGAGDGRTKRVVEAKVHHVPLKRRLKLSSQERAIIAGVTRSAETEMDRLNTHSRTNYGATGGVYSAVPPTEAEAQEAAALERSIRRSTAQADAHRQDCCNQLCCCACLDNEWAHDTDLKSIFCAGKPIWYFRAVELQIMFTCMYMALWATNFLTMVREQEDFSFEEEVACQLLMLVPILVSFHRVAYIAETYSLIMAICELDIEALYDVLVNTEDMAIVAGELRKKINSKIRAWARTETPSEAQEKMFVHLLFEEVDQDGSGAIDKGEFRQMLRQLNLSYSDTRFNLLFRAVDSIGGDGKVEEADLQEFMFPTSDLIDADEDSVLSESAGAVDAPSRHQGPGTHSWPIQQPHEQLHQPGAPLSSLISSITSGAASVYAAASSSFYRKAGTNVSPAELEGIRESVRASQAMTETDDPSFVCTVKSGANEHSWINDRNKK